MIYELRFTIYDLGVGMYTHAWDALGGLADGTKIRQTAVSVALVSIHPRFTIYDLGFVICELRFKNWSAQIQH